MSDKTTFIYTPEGGAAGGFDANLLAAMNGGGFGGGMNNPFWAIILLAFLRNNFGWNGEGCNCNANYVASQISQAVAGNGNAISNLATNLNCSIGQIQQAIAAVQQQMTNIGYENRINNTEQTAILGGKIDQQTTLINDKFCQLEMRGIQDKLDAERAKNLALTNQLSQEHQNAYFASMIAPIQNEIAGIKCRLPETVNVPAPVGTLIPSCVSWQLGLQNLGLNPGGSIWS